MLVTLAHWINDTYQAFLAPLLPVLIEKFSLTKSEAGLLSVCFQIPSLTQPFVGYLADRIGMRYFVILSPAIAAVLMSLLGVAPSYGVLVLLLLATGLSTASIHSVGPVMIGRASGTSLGRGLGFWMVGGELGRAVGPILVVSAVSLLGLGGLPWLMIGGVLTSVLLYARLHDIPVHMSSAQKEAARDWARALRAMRPLLLPLVPIMLARGLMLTALTVFLPVFLHEGGSSLWLAGASLSILEGAGVVGAFSGGALSDRFGRRRIILISLSATPLLMMAFLSTDGWLRFPLLVLMGAPAFALTPVLMAMVQETFPDNRALANGAYMAVGFSLRAVATLLMGMIGDLIGLRTGFWIAAVAPLVVLPLVAQLPGRASPSRSAHDRH